MNSPITTTASGALVLADRLADWSSMARGAFAANTLRARAAFAANTLRAWRADWESRGVTVGDLRDVVTALFHIAERPKGGPERERGVRCATPNNPSLGRTHAFDGWPRMDTQGLGEAGSGAQCCGQNFPRF